MFFALLVSADAPFLVNYQAVVRSGDGQPLVENTPVAVKFSIHQDSPTGPVVFTELQSTYTNKFGLINLKIGAISSLLGVQWGSGDKHLQVQIDINNSGSFIDMGTSQLISVPYALYAAHAAVDTQAVWRRGGNTAIVPVGKDFLGKTDGSNLNLQPGAGNVGIGTYNATHKLQLNGSHSLRFKGVDGIMYVLSANDTINSIGTHPFPHVAMMAGPASGIHSIVSLENINYNQVGSPYFAVFGIIDNSGPLRYCVSADTSGIKISAGTSAGVRSRYLYTPDGVHFRNDNTGSGYFQKSTGGTAGQVLTLSPFADTASWQPTSFTFADSATIYSSSPRMGVSYYCHDCTGNGQTGRVVVSTAAGWRRIRFED